MTMADLALYAGAMVALTLTPGPVWLALIARALAGGFASAWPLALGVTIGDAVWPLAAILGVSWLVQEVAGLMGLMRLAAAAIFLFLGLSLIRSAGAPIAEDRRLTRPGRLAGFSAGAAVALGNPKSILFYVGVLPGFFDLPVLGRTDIAAIVAVSMAVPLLGNLVLALCVVRIRRLMRSETAVKRLNQVSAALLILVGLAILAA